MSSVGYMASYESRLDDATRAERKGWRTLSKFEVGQAVEYKGKQVIVHQVLKNKVIFQSKNYKICVSINELICSGGS
mgnify:CR=1 FL=1